jgi:hypothetical protein
VANDTGRDGISPATYCGGMAIMSMSMYLVLAFSTLPEGSWVRIVIQWILIAQMALWLGASMWLRFRKKTSRGPEA